MRTRHTLLLTAVAILTGAAVAWGPPQRGWEAALLLAELTAEERPGPLARRTDAPRRPEIRYGAERQLRIADLYLPAGRAGAGIVLLPGAHPEGRDDPRVVKLATALARLRFAVLVPESAALRELRVSAAQVDEVADAVRHLDERPELTPDARLGVAAFSYAVGPAVLAAMRPETRHRIDFILGVGGYHDLTRVIRYFTTGHYRTGEGGWRRREPNRYGMWIFALSNHELIRNTADRRTFRRIIRRKLEDPDAPIDDLATRLGPEGRALHALLANRDPARTEALIKALPDPMRRLIRDLDLADKDLGALKARLILVHSRGDAIIPYTESVALARDAPHAKLYLLGGGAHVGLEDPDWRDRLRLWSAARALLAERTP